MNVELRVEARNDLVDAAGFYEAQREGLGDCFIDCLFAGLESLESEAGIHELAYGLHRKLSERFPFAIYYRVADRIQTFALGPTFAKSFAVDGTTKSTKATKIDCVPRLRALSCPLWFTFSRCKRKLSLCSICVACGFSVKIKRDV